MSKQFLNQNANVVHESLEGLLWQRPDLQRVPGTNSIVKRSIDRDKVQIVCGGGSGHEPAHAGFVFHNCLDAAVCGDVFASPSHRQIMTTLKFFAECKRGILLVVKNYQGDVINFSLAAKLARIQFGIPVEVFVFGDDVAFDNNNNNNDRRGVAGTVLLYKILGDIAHENKSVVTLDGLVRAAKDLSANMRTYGAALESCTLPGKTAPNVDMKPDEMEFGLGIHGEAGNDRRGDGIPDANTIIKIMLDKVIGGGGAGGAGGGDQQHKSPSSSPSPSRHHHQHQQEEEVIVALNNLGSVTQLEMGLLVDSLMNRIITSKNGGSKVLRVAQLITGSFMTSLDMKGISITVLFRRGALQQEGGGKLWEQTFAALEKPCAPGVPWACVAYPGRRTPSAVLSSHVRDDHDDKKDNNKKTEEPEEETTPEGIALRRVVHEVISKIETIADRFDELDAAVGDGDMGRGVARGCRAAKTVPVNFSTSAKQSFAEIGSAVADAFAGTSGPMVGAMIAVGGSHIRSEKASECAGSRDFALAVVEGVKAVREIGGAMVGDRTMVDVLQPIADLCRAVAAAEADDEKGEKKEEELLSQLLSKLIEVAKREAQAVQRLTARKGRSRYLQERVVGKPDPGCEFVVAVLEAIRAAL